VAWAFIVARALVAPVCAMYLATLGKRVVARREMYGNLMLSIGGTIQEILEQLQFGADIRLIRPLWEMQRLVDRASRARNDDEMDGYDERLLTALEELCSLRDRLDLRGTGETRETRDPGEAVRALLGVPHAAQERTSALETAVAVDAVRAPEDTGGVGAGDGVVAVGGLVAGGEDATAVPMPSNLNRRKAVAAFGHRLEAQTRR
jgi:hypothetical protein